MWSVGLEMVGGCYKFLMFMKRILLRSLNINSSNQPWIQGFPSVLALHSIARDGSVGSSRYRIASCKSSSSR